MQHGSSREAGSSQTRRLEDHKTKKQRKKHITIATNWCQTLYTTQTKKFLSSLPVFDSVHDTSFVSESARFWYAFSQPCLARVGPLSFVQLPFQCTLLQIW